MSLHSRGILEEAGTGDAPIAHQRLSPLLKWTGGKKRELGHILGNKPDDFRGYYEPFVGGGSVYTAMPADRYYINDKSHELIDLYKIIVGKNRGLFFDALEEINTRWDMIGEISGKNRDFFLSLYREFVEGKVTKDGLTREIDGFVQINSKNFRGLFSSFLDFDIDFFIEEINKNLIRRLFKQKSIEEEQSQLPEEKQKIPSEKDIMNNVEAALKSAFYLYLRLVYNRHKECRLAPASYTAIFLFIRTFAFNGMFRYNKSGDFDVPYGGISYNNNRFRKRVQYLRSTGLSALLERSEIYNGDFESFFDVHPPTEEDFVFLDPPYDTKFSTYAGNLFGNEDQERLARYLLEKCEAKWMMVIKETAFISGLYDNQPGVNISSYDHEYTVNFKGRVGNLTDSNAKKVQHLLINNYRSGALQI